MILEDNIQKQGVKTMRVMKIFICGMLTMMVSGCAAFSSRIVGMGPFAGVRTDYMMCFQRDRIDPGSRIHPALAVLDFPFSLAGDILFLPYDICVTGHSYPYSLTNEVPSKRENSEIHKSSE